MSGTRGSLLFVAGMLGLTVGGALGCYVALRQAGEGGKGLTAALAGGLGLLATQLLWVVPVVMPGAQHEGTVIAASVASMLLAPLAARALAVQLSPVHAEVDGEPPDRPLRRAW